MEMTEESIPKRYKGAFRRWKNRMDTPLSELFWAKVNAKGPDDCWPFRSAVRRGVYGTFLIRGENPKQARAHRLAWILVRGHIPDNLEVCHKCDYPPCCNPDHLFLGTHRDNAVDMTQKGRNYLCYGERSATHKLTDAQVISIRERYHPAKTTYVLLAKEYGVSTQTIRQAVTGVTWKHLPMGDRTVRFNRGAAHPKAMLTNDKVREIRNRFDGGEQVASIARALKIPYTTVCGVAKRKRWTHVT